MIDEFSIHARPSNKKARRVVTAALVSAALCVAACMVAPRYGGLISVCAMLFFTLAILFYTKYVAAEYIYEITHDSAGTPVFVVRSRTGRRETTLLRLDLGAIRQVRRIEGEELLRYRSEAGVASYNYCPSFRPDSAILLTVRSRYEKADVKLELTDEFASHLLSLAELARTESGIDDEE